MEEVVRLRESALEWRRVDEQVLVLDSATARYLALNETGAALWERLAAGATKADLVRALVESYGVDEGRAIADVDALLADLRRNGLLAA